MRKRIMSDVEGGFPRRNCETLSDDVNRLFRLFVSPPSTDELDAATVVVDRIRPFVASLRTSWRGSDDSSMHTYRTAGSSKGYNLPNHVSAHERTRKSSSFERTRSFVLSRSRTSGVAETTYASTRLERASCAEARSSFSPLERSSNIMSGSSKSRPNSPGDLPASDTSPALDIEVNRTTSLVRELHKRERERRTREYEM